MAQDVFNGDQFVAHFEVVLEKLAEGITHNKAALGKGPKIKKTQKCGL